VVQILYYSISFSFVSQITNINIQMYRKFHTTDTSSRISKEIRGSKYRRTHLTHSFLEDKIEPKRHKQYVYVTKNNYNIKILLP